MKLIEYKKDEKIFENKKIVEILNDSFIIEQFYSENYDRYYDVFKLSSNNSSIILKKTIDEDEINLYKVLSKKIDRVIPRIYFIEKENDYYWIAIEYIKESKKYLDFNDANTLLENLAYIHTTFSNNTKQIYNIVTWKRISRKDLNKLIDNEICKEYIEIIDMSQSVLENTYKTIIHGDMIPLNILITKKDVKIIDWEYGKVGPYILDIGRLLGDYNIDKLWVNKQWEDKLLKTYFDNLRNSNIKCTYNQFLLEYQCAKLNNYLRIIYAFKTRKWDRTEWYNLNLKELINTINIIKKYI